MTTNSKTLPAAHLDVAKMPGHWLLARMGKRVLRPGGIEMTRRLLDALAVGPDDVAVELAPGLGTTARLVLEREPALYIGVERDEAAATGVRRVLGGSQHRCRTGTASDTGLDDASASVVFGEAMLTMQTAAQKRSIVREALRVLRPGGRYGIHELGLTEDGATESVKEQVSRDISSAIHVGARPLTVSEWRTVLEEEGFVVQEEAIAPMHLLEPTRMIRDEGVLGAARILFNVLRNPAARRRIVAMRAAFRKHRRVLCAVMLVAKKPDAEGRA